MMKTVEVQYASGREVMSAFWGFLEHGGLVLTSPSDLGNASEGEAVRLSIHVRSLKQRFVVPGRVARVVGDRIYIAFAGGPQPEELLNASYSDAEDVPLRKYYRANAEESVEYGLATGSALTGVGSLINLSAGGCCVLGPVAFAKGTRIRLRALGVEVEGQVRWVTRRGDMGIELQPGTPLYSRFTEARAAVLDQ